MARQYTDTTSVELFLSDAFQATVLDINNSFSVAISFYIDQMSKYIEEYTGRQFIADTSDSVRLFEIESEDAGEIGRYSVAPNKLKIDECVSFTKLEVKGGISDDFVQVSRNLILTYPANRTPITRLYVDDGASTQLKIGQQNLKVTAKWGYSVSAPDDIKFAAMVLVAGILQYSHRHQGQQKSLSMGRYQVVYDNQKQMSAYEQAMAILDSYKVKSIVS
jgi:hypothetical protein